MQFEKLLLGKNIRGPFKFGVKIAVLIFLNYHHITAENKNKPSEVVL